MRLLFILFTFMLLGSIYAQEEQSEEERIEEEFTKEEQVEINKMLGDMLRTLPQKIIPLGAKKYKDRVKGIHDFEIYLKSIYNTPEDDKHYKYRIEKLRTILVILVDLYRTTDDMEIKLNVLPIIRLTFDFIKVEFLYKDTDESYGSDVEYETRMFDIYFKDFLKDNNLEKVIDASDK